MYSQSTSSLLNSNFNASSAVKPLQFSAIPTTSTDILSGRENKEGTSNKCSKQNIILADYKDDLSKMKPDEHELENLRIYKQFLQNVSFNQPYLQNGSNKARKELVPDRVQSLCRRILLDYEENKLPTDEEFNHFTECLESSEQTRTVDIEGKTNKTISFYGLISVLRAGPKSINNFFSPVTFFRAHFPEWNFQRNFRIHIDAIPEFLSLKISFMRNRIDMARYDSDSTGHLTKTQLLDFYKEIIMPRIDPLKDLEETFQICYLNTVESMFFFFLDTKHTGRIRIVDALVSGFLENAFSLQTNSEDYDNWFSPEKTHEMNASFQLYDSKRKNYLEKCDFKQVQSGSFTQTFIDRLFETHVVNGGEAMSYEEFVIFNIAYNHLVHPASMAYFFKILDVNEDGFLSRFELQYFYSDLCKSYNDWVAMDGAMPAFDDFADQFFDMIKPVDDGKISLQELLDCKQGHDFVLCLINYQEFYRYDTRDSENGTISQDSALELFGDLDGAEEEDLSPVENIKDDGNTANCDLVNECNNNNLLI